MGTDLRNALRSLCLDSTWQYAVFWKLEYRSRLVLTWEDAYYDNCGHPISVDNRCCFQKPEHFLYQNDQLGLAVSKMSYHVYSLGEGIVGQVAATGNHQWIIADSFLSNSFLSSGFSDGWQSQFLAGIRTIVVVAVDHHGVVQLGSLNEVIEDMKFVGHVREVFLTLQDSLFGNCLRSTSLPNTTVEAVNKHEMIVSPTPGTDDSEKLSQLRSNDLYLEKQRQVMMNLITNQFFERECTLLKDGDSAAKCGFISPSYDSASNKKSSDSLPGPSQKFGSNLANPSVNFLDASVCDGVSSYQSSVLNNPESSSLIVGQDLENTLACEAQTSYLDSSNIFTTFSAGYELLEALGPFFKTSTYHDCEQEKTEAGSVVEMPEVLSSSEMVFDTGSESLLEAVVSSACQSGSDVVSEKSACNSVRSMLPSEKLSEPPNWSKVISQASLFKHSFAKDNAHDCSNSTDVCGALSSIGFAPTSMSACSEGLDRHSEPAKNNKKRARPGESCRPRPRDRQLIQDRIKELRELVPNGAKCSIDSLLERTMKHMLFLESITKHADKLNQCAESKMHQKGMGTSNYDQGSSWAVEVGGHIKVSSIVVENLNKDGQMLVEMICEECNHFLEIAEAIRGLGLTILKGVTEVQGDKTWICFIVEGQNNRIMHRMDILWSLVPVLQPKTPS